MRRGYLDAGLKSGDGHVGTVPMRRRTLILVALGGVLALALVATAFAPVVVATREELFEVPEGTWKRRMAGDKVDILPQTPWASTTFCC